jgi:hypothetical protein
MRALDGSPGTSTSSADLLRVARAAAALAGHCPDETDTEKGLLAEGAVGIVEAHPQASKAQAATRAARRISGA